MRKPIAYWDRMRYSEREKKGEGRLEQQVCAFTGHRPERFVFGYQEDHPDCVRLKGAIATAIGELVHAGVTTFISGMAQGVDLWAAREVLRRRRQQPQLRLIAALPCADQAAKWPEPLRQEYEEILVFSDERVCLHGRYTPHCMMERNRWMVDHAGVLLAVYDGVSGGGTAATVRYAQGKRREIWLLDPVSLRLARMSPPQAYEQMSLE